MKNEDQLESVVNGSHLVERQVCDLTPEGARIDCTDHLAHDPRLLVTDHHLGWKLAGGVEVDVGQTTIVESARRSSAWTITAKRRPCWTLPRPRGSLIS